jgi:DNA polymerase-3 subunit delta'
MQFSVSPWQVFHSRIIMNFADIEGHERPLAILKRALANKTLAHAYLFSGETGIGKKMTALALAAAANCSAANGNGGCGACASCRGVASLTHPDIHVVMPESENERLLAGWSDKAVEKASDEIKIDQIRQAQESLTLTPSGNGKKVLIVDGAETLNAAAQNAFLKTLEEPPGDALIVLITPMPQGLLPTIRSRCQEIKFLPLPRRTLAQALIRRRGLAEEDALFLAALSQGSMGRSLEMDVEQEKAAREGVMTLWSGLRQMGPGDALAKAEALSRDRDGLERLLDIGVELLRDALVFRATRDEKLLVYGQGRDALRMWGEQAPFLRMLADMDLFLESRELLGRRASAQLVAENLLLKLARG